MARQLKVFCYSDGFQADLAGLDQAQAEETAAVEAERVALDRRAAALAKRQAAARDDLKAKLKAARETLS